MGVNAHQNLKGDRLVVREPSGHSEDGSLSPEPNEPSCPQKKPTSGKVTPETAFQMRRRDKSGRFVDFQVPDRIIQKSVRDWIQELRDPAQMDPRELYVSLLLLHPRGSWTMLTTPDLLKGPIVAQKEWGPIYPGLKRQEPRPVLVPDTPPEPAAQTTSAPAAQRGHGPGTTRPLPGQPASPIAADGNVNARPVLQDGEHIRNRVIQNLRDVSGALPRDEEDGPQVPDDAPRVASSQGPQDPSPGGATPSGPSQFTGTYAWVWTATRTRMH